MLGTKHTTRTSRYGSSQLPYAEACGGTWRAAYDVTPEEEENANRNAPAAIVACDRCRERHTIEGSNTHANRRTPPDLTVFDVAPAKG